MNQPTVQLYQGDCLEFMKTLTPGMVDAVVTDPPYGTWAQRRCKGKGNYKGIRIYQCWKEKG